MATSKFTTGRKRSLSVLKVEAFEQPFRSTKSGSTAFVMKRIPTTTATRHTPTQASPASLDCMFTTIAVCSLQGRSKFTRFEVLQSALTLVSTTPTTCKGSRFWRTTRTSKSYQLLTGTKSTSLECVQRKTIWFGTRTPKWERSQLWTTKAFSSRGAL